MSPITDARSSQRGWPSQVRLAWRWGVGGGGMSPLKLGATLTIPILQANPALFWPMSTRTGHQHHHLCQKSEQMNNLLKKVSDLLICSLKVSDQSDSLTVTHSLWATWANLSWSLIFGEWPKRFAHIRAGNPLICSLLIHSFCSNQMSECEPFAQVAKRKWATMSKLLRSRRGNERPWANRSGHSRQMSNHERFAQVAQRKWANERFAQKILAKKI